MVWNAYASNLKSQYVILKYKHCVTAASINTVMSCQAVWNKTVNNETAESFTALVYAAIIDLDLDGLMPQTVTKW